MRIKELLTELTFYGQQCTRDCSGHRAGHAWAALKGVDNAQDCGGSSPSFAGGCRVSAQQTTMARQRKKPRAANRAPKAANGRFQSQGSAAFGAMAQQLPTTPTKPVV